MICLRANCGVFMAGKTVQKTKFSQKPSEDSIDRQIKGFLTRYSKLKGDSVSPMYMNIIIGLKQIRLLEEIKDLLKSKNV